jgi:hypothetical protein
VCRGDFLFSKGCGFEKFNREMRSLQGFGHNPGLCGTRAHPASAFRVHSPGKEDLNWVFHDVLFLFLSNLLLKTQSITAFHLEFPLYPRDSSSTTGNPVGS